MRNGGIAAFTCGAETDQNAPQALEQDLVDIAATVPAIIDDQRLLIHLRIKLTDELLRADRLHVGEIDVGDFAA